MISAKTFQRLIAAAGFAVALGASANALMSLQGKLTTITKTEYFIETAKNVYVIKRKLLTDQQTRALTRTEVNVSLQVPMDAIERVTPIKKEKN